MTRTHGHAALWALWETRVDCRKAPLRRHSLNSRVRSTFFVSLCCELCVFVSIVSQGFFTACLQAKNINAEQKHLRLKLYNILFLLVVKRWATGLVDVSRLVSDSFLGARGPVALHSELELKKTL